MIVFFNGARLKSKVGGRFRETGGRSLRYSARYGGFRELVGAFGRFVGQLG